MTFQEIFDPPQCVPLWIWAKKLDEGCRKRLVALADWDRLAGPIAVMPDVHAAGNICVGTVFAAKDVLVPGMMGDDLGCGMAVEKLSIPASAMSRELLLQVVTELRKKVPVGRQTHRLPQTLPRELLIPLCTKQLTHQRDWLGVRQFGTLGGGNHFVELQSDALDGLWATVHVGSRGMGAAIAAYHQIRAERLNGRKKFAWLSSNDSDGEAFWADLQWALSFAVENRRRILEQVRAAMSLCLNIDATATEWMDSPHNFIARETHGNQELFIHRKGAMSAPAGKRGLIPGSMGTASYIVEGLGNPEAYGSSSHGAGRILSRTEARRKITVKQLRREMGRVVYPNDSATLQAMVEEAPSAYRKINDVLAQQSDLVRPILRLEPLAVIKGD